MELIDEIRAKNPGLAARADAGAPLVAIRLNCLECMGGSSDEVKRCSAPRCALHPFRFGRSPRAKREMSEEQRAMCRERLRLAREQKDIVAT